MSEQDIKEFLTEGVPGAPDPEGWGDQAQRNYRRRRAMVGGAAGGLAAVAAAALLVPMGLMVTNLTDPTRNQAVADYAQENAAPMGAAEPEAATEEGAMSDAAAAPGEDDPGNPDAPMPFGDPPQSSLCDTANLVQWDGKDLAPGATSIVLCQSEASAPKVLPQEALTSGVEQVVATINSLPAAPDDLICTLELGEGYQVRVNYPDRSVVLDVEEYSCLLVHGANGEPRVGSDQVSEALRVAFQQQRASQTPPTAQPVPGCGQWTDLLAPLTRQDFLDQLSRVTRAYYCPDSFGKAKPVELDAEVAKIFASATPDDPVFPDPMLENSMLILVGPWGEQLRVWNWTEDGNYLIELAPWSPDPATAKRLTELLPS